MRATPRTLPLLLALLLASALAAACFGGGSKSKDGGQATNKSIPMATLPASLPDLVIVHATAVPSGERYVIQSGDSPSSIAAQFGISVDELLSANGITDPTALVAGEQLVIPTPMPGDSTAATETPPGAPGATSTPAAPPTPAQQTYIVQQGDIPETIAAQFGITAEQLMAANGITDPSSLQVGQELIIPAPQ